MLGHECRLLPSTLSWLTQGDHLAARSSLQCLLEAGKQRLEWLSHLPSLTLDLTVSDLQAVGEMGRLTLPPLSHRGLPIAGPKHDALTQGQDLGNVTGSNGYQDNDSLLDAMPEACLWAVMQMLDPVDKYMLGRAWKPASATTYLRKLPISAFCRSSRVMPFPSYSPIMLQFSGT